MVEWSITTDCKSVGFGLRRFESCPAHMESPEKPKYSQERFDALKERFNNADLFGSDEVAWMAEGLRIKYPDYESYAFYHILSGSTIDESIAPIKYEDFPGEDSVELFIDSLINPK